MDISPLVNLERDDKMELYEKHAIAAVIGGILATVFLIEAMSLKSNGPFPSAAIPFCGSVVLFFMALYAALRAWETWQEERNSKK